MESIDMEIGHVRSDEDVRPLTNSIRNMFKNLEPPRTSECCIYRIPGSLRNLNEAAYTPRVISIGPFHRGKNELQTMEKYKVRCLNDFLQWIEISLEDMVISIKEWEERVRRCYAEIIEPSSDELVKMILLDGCFIIKYFLRWWVPDDKNREALYKPWLENDILFDLILLENQLPFFVLEKLYNLDFPSSSPTRESDSLLSIALGHFSYFNRQYIFLKEDQEVKHFTDLLRTFHLPSSPMLPLKKVDKEYRYSLSAMELHEAGVKFKVNSSRCLFDICFTNEMLQIPHFFIDNRTESLFRNLMALEQCYYPDETYICDYIILMDTLINTAKDVELLAKKRIISNCLGGANDADVAILFHNLSQEITVNFLGRGQFSKLGNDLTEYSNNWKSGFKRHYFSTLKRDYFSTPWRTVSTFAAVILLVLTFMQTVNSFISL